METEALEELGLTRNEAIVYITLLDFGKAHIGQISERTRMHRRTIYDCLERLEDRGLASFIIEGKTRFFIAINPRKLKEIIKEKEAKIEDIFPKLLEIANKSKIRTEVSVHKGKEGLKNIMEDVVKSKPKEWLSLTSAAKASVVLPFYLPQFHDKRIKEKIKLKIVFGKNKEAIKRANELKRTKLTEVKFIDTEYVIPISMWIYGNKLAFMLWDSETGILIENKETSDTFKKYFEILWKTAKPK
ncbi:MAG: helix-turn-helix domain-containing protein [Candidatus Nanoarchaeia archaeon]|nr:helix-turn-helix domain-containing protein [Candidatus Nanoarchaeia archaeon]MDD5741053.1 helix-turn-helix domain-containing protein [Candidatus Nanoarchaeia archaeon]